MTKAPSTLKERAFRAYLATDGISAEQPNDGVSAAGLLNGLDYVVLASSTRTVAVYRVGRTGKLRRLKRWPLALGRSSNPAAVAGRRAEAGAAHV
ncbi:MAG: hypothetical protein P8Z80_21215 [Pseudolabrys sp.]